MKRNFRREIALLSLPILIIGGMAFGGARMRSWSDFGTPLEMIHGKARFEITKWEKVTPTAVDFGRGISSRWKLTMWHGGACPAGSVLQTPLYNGLKDPEELYFGWERGGKTFRTPLPLPQSGVEASEERKGNSPWSEVNLGLPMDLVPSDAEKVWLGGHLKIRGYCSDGSTEVSTPLIHLVLKESGEVGPKSPVPTVSPLKLGKVEYRTEKYLGVNVRGEFSYLGNPKNRDLSCARSWITDFQGNYVAELWTFQPLIFPGNFRCVDWFVGDDELKAHQGPFTLKSWVYADPNEWPLQVSIPLNLPKPLKPVR